MKRKHEVPNNLFELVETCMLSFKMSNLIYEYLIPFELRPSYVTIPKCRPNMLPTKSGWVYTEVADGEQHCRSTFSTLDVPCVSLATQFFDHAWDSDAVVLLVQKESSFDVETWDAAAVKRIAAFPVGPSIFGNSLVHLPGLQKILSWRWDDWRNGGSLNLVDYTGSQVDKIEFTKEARLLDIVCSPDSQDYKLLFLIRQVESHNIRLKILVNGQHPEKKKDTLCNGRSLYWLHTSSWSLVKDATRRHEEEIAYRFYRRCYRSREFSPVYIHECQDDWQLGIDPHRYIVRFQVRDEPRDDEDVEHANLVEALHFDLNQVKPCEPTEGFFENVPTVQCGTRREFILHFSDSSFLVKAKPRL
jgi:hypothetical protein